MGRVAAVKSYWQLFDRLRAHFNVPEEFYETKSSGFGPLKAIKHSARIGGRDVGWDVMPKPLGADDPEWDA